MSSLAAMGLRGFTAVSVLSALRRQYPHLANTITQAQVAGYTGSQILRALNGGKGKEEDYLTDAEKAYRNYSKQKKKAAYQAAGMLALAAGAGGAAYAATRGAAGAAMQVLPALPRGGAGSTPSGPVTLQHPQNLLPLRQKNIPHNPSLLGGQQPRGGLPPQAGLPYYPQQPPQSPQGQPPAPMAPQGQPPQAPNQPAQQSPTLMKNVALIKNLKQETAIENFFKQGMHPLVAASVLRDYNMPKHLAKMLDKSEGGLDQVVQDYYQFLEQNPPQERQQFNQQMQQAPQQQEQAPMMSPQYGLGSLSPEKRQQELLKKYKPITGETATDLSQRMGIGYADAAYLLENNDQKQPPIEPPAPPIQEPVAPVEQPIKPIKQVVPDIEKEIVAKLPQNLINTPMGIGEITHDGKSGVIANVDGKKKSFKHDDVTKPPVDLEDAVRHIVNSIPENEKSTNLQSATYVPLPNGNNVMIVKFYDGKVAWYTDVPEELYDNIAQGTYAPKTTGKTGIAEYKPSVVDSRGAGFSSEIARHPKYSKENKGKTWGYAKNDYDAFNMIQPIVHKISKERLDAKGNVIQPKKRNRSQA